jgi:ACS family D-galactonate transporter-like MFS transporter
MWILVLLNFVDRSALSISLPFISKEYEITPALQGWILSSFFWTYLVFQLPGGWLLDRIGPRRVVSYAGVVWGLFQVLGGVITGGGLLVVSRLGLGAAEAPVSPSAAKLNSSWLPSKERARGATFVDMAGAFGTAVGGLIVTGLIGVTGSWRAAFVITGILTVLLSVLNFIAIRDTPEGHGKVNAAELDHIRDGLDPAASVETASSAPGLLDYARSRSFWGLWFGRLGWATVWWGIISWTPSYLSNSLHFSLAGLGWGTFFVYGVGVLGELLSGWATDRFRSRISNWNLVMKVILGISGVGTVVSILLVSTAHTGELALVYLALAVFFNQMGGIYWAMPAWLAPKRQVGTVGGVMNVASSLGGGIAPVAIGLAITAGAGSYAGAFVFLGFAGAVYLVGSMLIDFMRPLARSRHADGPDASDAPGSLARDGSSGALSR